MSFETEKREARAILAAIEDGGPTPAQTFRLLQGADPTLVHFVFAWLRAHYPSSHPSSDGVLGRLGTLCTEHPQAARMARTGGEDPLVAWFAEAHSYRALDADAFIDLIVEKLEG
jgi:hypothetical protein